jgi:hypothetical protein
MRKKGARSIPDFSRQPKGPRDTAVPPSKSPPVVAPQAPVVRPQAKPPKSGQRGR